MKSAGVPALAMLFLTALVVWTGLGRPLGPDPTYRTLREHVGVALDGPNATKLSPEERRALDRAFVRLGILEVPPALTFEERVRRRLGEVPAPVARTFQSVRFIDEWPPDAVVVVTVDTIVTIPGNPEIGFHLVRSDGTVAATPEVPTGYRSFGPTVRRARAPGLGLSVYEVVAMPGPGGGGLREFYARNGDRFVLIRMEGMDDATLRKNDYGAPNWTVGPPAPPRGEIEWIALLDSGDPVSVLEALVWLGGVHLDPDAAEPDTWHEDVRTAKLWYDLVTRGDVQNRFSSLAGSDQPWIAEAARSALEIEVYPRRSHR
jgi:hypothetical protein